MSSFVESIKSVKNPFTSSEEQEDSQSFLSESTKSCPKLSYKQRVIGFGVCIGLSALLAILGAALSWVSPAAFAVLFTLGVIAGICSTFFLVSPIKQAKNIYDPSNKIGMVIKISCIIALILLIALVFCSVFWWHVEVLGLILCIVIFVVLVIYAITLIPFATTLISRGARSALSI